ncbi:uncharacterized protein LOC122575995 [Bombus pyrosoma]|uniref:uncharacterized protein LOC122575995 n=1 Tax=Bombus pyrosoma TaxID=396416 RepID=UPI001CB9260F|nr:uncharacterized protein LOC122575995 [Bombus pyrosoma]XP_043601575.1 uncharacterized protein LOC122575995 [Bombus pyrosoma]XP_043601577.1 uncharacterized protein LOC122575995 [Bombus pyrosoma]XP_043601578.1 uncharacterized protein LOC122575995 [Bombus pyrosoma]
MISLLFVTFSLSTICSERVVKYISLSIVYVCSTCRRVSSAPLRYPKFAGQTAMRRYIPVLMFRAISWHIHMYNNELHTCNLTLLLDCEENFEVLEGRHETQTDAMIDDEFDSFLWRFDFFQSSSLAWDSVIPVY